MILRDLDRFEVPLNLENHRFRMEGIAILRKSRFSLPEALQKRFLGISD